MVFVSTKEKPKEDYTIAVINGVVPKKGEVGIEVEVEGFRLPKENLPPEWKYVPDGSLRGRDSAEYVLVKPLSFEEADKAVDALFARFKAARATLDESNRTSVHVHLNVLPFYHNRLVSLMCLWYTFEEPLINWCGEFRVGNLFCLPGKDASASVSAIKRYVQASGSGFVFRDGLHYAAVNPAAILKYGSVEIRTMRGVTDPAPLKKWVKILQKLYEQSDRFPDPRAVCENMSLEGPVSFFHQVFEEHAREILDGSKFNEDRLSKSLLEGSRVAQDLAYCRDWSNFNPIVIEQDPFGRTKKKKKEELVQPDPDEHLAEWFNRVAAEFEREIPIGRRVEIRNG